MGLVASEKHKPILFVGLGGNGGKIVNQLAGRLKRHPSWSQIKDLTHFVVIDTNKDDLDKLRAVNPDTRFLISAFDNAAYVARKRGLAQNDPDPLVIQWIPDDYKFRSTQGAGAGQIRMESRLRLYYALEGDRAGIRRKVRQMFEAATGRDNPYRDNEDKVIRVMIYGSVAGGTGSGGFLPVAYLLRQMVQDHGWGRPSVTAVLSLPTTFLNKVKPQLHDDIKANGYAALKELEYLTRCLGYAGGPEKLRFHYDPGTNDETRCWIHDRPFDVAYLIDRPSEMSIERFEHAVADVSYLQLFSPLLGHQAGEYDNYEKRQKSLALDHFSVHYGTFGTSLLQLPRNDLVTYSAMRYVAKAFREYLCFGGNMAEFRVNYGSPAFERLSPAEKNHQIDDKFLEYVGWQAERERREDFKGFFTAVQEQEGKGGKLLPDAFLKLISDKFGKLDELIEVPDFKIQEISEGNPSVSRQINELRRAYSSARSKVISEYLGAVRTELRNGTLLGRFFDQWDVNPIAQRLFLIRLLRGGPILPFEDPEEGEYLVEKRGSGFDIEAKEIQDRVSRLNTGLAQAADQGVLQRLVLDRDNKEFNAAKRKAIGFLNELGLDMVQSLQADFWRAVVEELELVAESLLTAYRTVAEIADSRAKELEAATEAFRRDPAVRPDSDVAQFYLDVEALRDDRRKERLWHFFYEHKLSKSAYFDAEAVFRVVTEAFAPQRDADGNLRTPDASEIVEAVQHRLEAQAGDVYRKALGPTDLDLDLVKALDLEQRYTLLLDDGHDLLELHATGKLDEAVESLSVDRVASKLEDKLKRLADECVLLSHIDQLQRDDQSIVPADVFYAGLAPRYDTDENDALGQVLRGVVSGLNFVSGWTEEDALVLYRATLGVPVYFFKNVNGVLYPSYRKVRDDSTRAYPLQIEAAWEKAPGLPDLDPVEMKRAREQEAAQQKAIAATQVREQRVLSFALCGLSGHVARVESGYAWNYEGATADLGSDRAQAFEAFERMDPDLRQELENAGRGTMKRKLADRRAREKVVAELEAAVKSLKAAMFAAAQDYRDAEKAFLKEEVDVLSTLVGELGSGADDVSLLGGS